MPVSFPFFFLIFFFFFILLKLAINDASNQSTWNNHRLRPWIDFNPTSNTQQRKVKWLKLTDQVDATAAVTVHRTAEFLCTRWELSISDGFCRRFAWKPLKNSSWKNTQRGILVVFLLIELSLLIISKRHQRYWLLWRPFQPEISLFFRPFNSFQRVPTHLFAA